jgi:aryl-alcohol dehydrogenase-like predicted oxidoreductase
MEYTYLGSTGTRVSQLCLGTWRFGRETGGVVETDRDQAHRLLDAAFEEYYLSERGWQVLDEIRTIADEESATPPQVALRWLIEQERFTCVPIVGARTTDQLDENVGAVDISLSDTQFDRVVDARYADDGHRWGHRR